MIRGAASWLLYLAGDLVCRACDGFFDDHGFGWQLWRLYQELMALSCEVQGDGPGPWESLPNTELHTEPG